MNATTWTVVILADAEGTPRTISVSGEAGNDVLLNPNGSVTIRRSWRSTGGGFRHKITYPAWRVTQITEEDA